MSATAPPPLPLEGEPCPICEDSVVVLCECGQGDPTEHLICLACGEDWNECDCPERRNA